MTLSNIVAHRKSHQPRISGEPPGEGAWKQIEPCWVRVGVLATDLLRCGSLPPAFAQRVGTVKEMSLTRTESESGSGELVGIGCKQCPRDGDIGSDEGLFVDADSTPRLRDNDFGVVTSAVVTTLHHALARRSLLAVAHSLIRPLPRASEKGTSSEITSDCGSRCDLQSHSRQNLHLQPKGIARTQQCLTIIK